jgi:hypothetical protein
MPMSRRVRLLCHRPPAGRRTRPRVDPPAPDHAAGRNLLAGRQAHPGRAAHPARHHRRRGHRGDHPLPGSHPGPLGRTGRGPAGRLAPVHRPGPGDRPGPGRPVRQLGHPVHRARAQLRRRPADPRHPAPPGPPARRRRAPLPPARRHGPRRSSRPQSQPRRSRHPHRLDPRRRRCGTGPAPPRRQRIMGNSPRKPPVQPTRSTAPSPTRHPGRAARRTGGSGS